MNLCTNAAHAVRERGGRLEVACAASRWAWKTWDSIRASTPGLHIKPSISYTGHSMTPEVAARIFDPFFATKAPGKGTGPGLAVVHGIITGCGESIRIYSEPGYGAVFHAMLPMINEATFEPRTEDQAIPGDWESILLVDDEKALVEVLERMLRDLGYRVSAFACPKQTLKAFQDQPRDYDLLLSDLSMPSLNGLDPA